MSHKVRQMIERAAALQSSHDANGLAALFEGNGTFEDVPLSRVTRGYDEMKAFWHETWVKVPDFNMNVTSIFADEEGGAAEWVMSETYTGEIHGQRVDAKPFSFKAASFVHLANGLIAHWSDYWSQSMLKQQLGVS